MKGKQESGEERLKVKSAAVSKSSLCASCLRLFGLVLNKARGPSWRKDAEEEVTDGTRRVFQSCGFNRHSFCTGNCDEKGLQIPVALVS